MSRQSDAAAATPLSKPGSAALPAGKSLAATADVHERLQRARSEQQQGEQPPAAALPTAPPPVPTPSPRFDVAPTSTSSRRVGADPYAIRPAPGEKPAEEELESMRFAGQRARPRKGLEYAPRRDETYLKPPGSCNTRWAPEAPCARTVLRARA